MLRMLTSRILLATTLAVGCSLLVASAQSGPGSNPTFLNQYLPTVEPGTLVPMADAYGPIRTNPPVAPVQRGGETIAWAFVTSDYVGTTGYSGKPIHVLVAVDQDARIVGAQLVDHSEPIVLIGIPEDKVRALTERHAGLDLREVAAGTTRDLDIISGATVTVVVIDDSIVRSGLKVARRLGLGGLAPAVADSGPQFELATGPAEPEDWPALAGDGSVRRLSLDVQQVNAAFERAGDARAIAKPEPGAPDDIFIDLYVGLATAPAIGRSLLGDAEYGNLTDWLQPGEHAIIVGGRGRYSFKGSGYVRGGLFDRIQLVQGDNSVRFRDRDQRRLGTIAASGAPRLTEVDLFRIPADAGFDPTAPWRLQLLVQRAVSALERSYLTFDLAYQIPERHLVRLAPPPVSHVNAIEEASESAARAALWRKIWRARSVEIAVLLAMLATLTAAFFFQQFATRNERVLFWFRIGFLSFTLVFLGWYASAQLSVVNLLALFSALTTDFTWSAFLLDPMVFILWFSVAAALVFWGRGPFCGWLCPFGALQELLNRLAKLARIPQWTVPWALHERLWPIKYVIFLVLFGLSLYSLEIAERAAEVEPFKTAITLKFQRAWPFVAFAGGLLVIGLFVERFYCRYLCPLGAALAIPARLRTMDWLKRYRECGNPCHRCARECMVQAIHPEGNINPNECLYCLHCQMLYQHPRKCPVVIKRNQRRQALHDRNLPTAGAALPSTPPGADATNPQANQPRGGQRNA